MITLDNPLLTIAQFSRHLERDHSDLVAGKLVERWVGAKAGLISGKVLAVLGPFVRSRRLGTLYSSIAGYAFRENDEQTLRFPDASFVAKGRLPDGKVPEGYFQLAPDFVVEVVSPNDGSCEVQEKVEEYLLAGTRAVAVIYPRAEVVLLFHADGRVLRFTSAMSLEIPELFPGFSCPVADLFTVE